MGINFKIHFVGVLSFFQLVSEQNIVFVYILNNFINKGRQFYTFVKIKK